MNLPVSLLMLSRSLCLAKYAQDIGHWNFENVLPVTTCVAQISPLSHYLHFYKCSAPMHTYRTPPLAWRPDTLKCFWTIIDFRLCSGTCKNHCNPVQLNMPKPLSRSQLPSIPLYKVDIKSWANAAEIYPCENRNAEFLFLVQKERFQDGFIFAHLFLAQRLGKGAQILSKCCITENLTLSSSCFDCRLGRASLVGVAEYLLVIFLDSSNPLKSKQVYVQLSFI